MEEKEKTELENQQVEARLFESIVPGQEVTIRDDLYEFHDILDAAEKYVGKKGRFRLIDTGVLEISQLEKIASSGSVIYTSDEAKRDVVELEFLGKSARKSGSAVALLHNQAFLLEGEQEGLSFSDLLNLSA